MRHGLRMSEGSLNAVRKDERHSFEPVARKYRRHGYFFNACVLTGIASGFVASVFHLDRSSPWFGGFFVFCILTGMVGMLLAPKLRRSACGANAGGELGVYCLECGSFPLEESRLFARRCTSCHKRFARSRRNNYCVRFCTNCGAYLDEKGL